MSESGIMFFIGATGQILTLFLTVFLPFVFLVSGHQKIICKEHNNYNRIDIQNKISLEDIDEKIIKYSTFNKVFQYHEELIQLEISDILKFPTKNIRVDKNHPFNKLPGNKAPPSLLFYFIKG